MLADTGLSFPDFRSSERTFQLLVQVAGRAGRGEASAKVLIQTFKPENEVLQFAASYDYKGLFKQELESRKLLSLPPFSESLKLTLREKSVVLLQEKVKDLVEKIKKIKEEKNLDLLVRNAPNSIPKIQKDFIWNVVVRGEVEILMKNLSSEDLKNWRLDRDPNSLSS